jgi:histidinol dehydrogenase
MITLKEVNSDEFINNLHALIHRNDEDEQIKEIVSDLLIDIKVNGDESLIKYIELYDKVSLKKEDIKVSKREFEEAYRQVNDNLINAIRKAKLNIFKFHRAQLRQDWSIEIEEGVKAGQIFRPIESVGIYIPAGKAIYPSTVLMAGIPAIVAGVNKIIICSPPQANQAIAPEILVAASELGIDEIYKIGGAQAIAAMAFGTEIVPAMDKIIGPGNKWVNAAKRFVSNFVAIDTPAGPSEIVIIADESTNHEELIIDLFSQIEHDPDNVGIIISDSDSLIEKLSIDLTPYLAPLERKEIIKQALKHNCFMIKARNIDECIDLSNIIAPEHLQLMITDYVNVMGKIKNAGAIFLGRFSPTALGDYCAGTNHILPTGGKAKTYSGLNVLDFLKIIDVLECEYRGLIRLEKTATTLAEYEGLTAHKKSIEIRLNKKD